MSYPVDIGFEVSECPVSSITAENAELVQIIERTRGAADFPAGAAVVGRPWSPLFFDAYELIVSERLRQESERDKVSMRS